MCVLFVVPLQEFFLRFRVEITKGDGLRDGAIFALGPGRLTKSIDVGMCVVWVSTRWVRCSAVPPFKSSVT